MMQNETISQLQSVVYIPCGLKISDFDIELESRDYKACNFSLNGKRIICRNAKTTPKKVGQFVTFWKRNKGGPIEPFCETDNFDLFIVNLQTPKALGQFVFPKSILIEKGIISTRHKEGKRAFRVYPNWDTPISKQALQTQKWQLNFFYEIKEPLDIAVIKTLYDF